MRQSVRVRQPMPLVAAVVSFIDGINRGDVDRLATLMADEHRLRVFDESPVEGKTANIEAWTGYMASFPEYVIYPHQVVTRNADVIVLGHTTGSHLGLSEEEESTLTVLWRASVADGRLTLWQLIADTPTRRAEFGLGDHP
jgi:ketosteroid isomerase-like protein